MYKLRKVNNAWVFGLEGKNDHWYFPNLNYDGWEPPLYEHPVHGHGDYGSQLDPNNETNHKGKCPSCGKYVPQHFMSMWKAMTRLKMQHLID